MCVVSYDSHGLLWCVCVHRSIGYKLARQSTSVVVVLMVMVMVLVAEKCVQLL